jgi:hypothetical protein
MKFKKISINGISYGEVKIYKKFKINIYIERELIYK